VFQLYSERPHELGEGSLFELDIVVPEVNFSLPKSMETAARFCMLSLKFDAHDCSGEQGCCVMPNVIDL
jgi:hypothetical protein